MLPVEDTMLSAEITFFVKLWGFGKAYLRNYVQVCKIRWLMQMDNLLSKVSARSQWRLLRTSNQDSWQLFQIQLKSPSFPLIPVISIWFIFLEVLHADWNSVEGQSSCLQHPHYKRKGNFINGLSLAAFFLYFTSKWILGAVCRCHNNKVSAGQFVCKWHWAWPDILAYTKRPGCHGNAQLLLESLLHFWGKTHIRISLMGWFCDITTGNKKREVEVW